MTSKTIKLPVVTGITSSFVNELDTRLEILLSTIGCQNIRPGLIQPLTTEQQIVDVLQVNDGVDEKPYYELWTFERTGTSHDALSHGTRFSYYQLHSVAIVGMYWRHSFENSYQHLQHQSELLMRTMEKNKNLLMTENSPILVSQNARFTWGNQSTRVSSGMIFLQRVVIDIGLLDEVFESGGKA